MYLVQILCRQWRPDDNHEYVLYTVTLKHYMIINGNVPFNHFPGIRFLCKNTAFVK